MTPAQEPFGTRITDVEVVRDYIVRLTFDDAVVGDVDLAAVIAHGQVFEPHRSDYDFFCRIYVDDLSGTIAWPNEVDLDPDVLYAKATGIYDGLVAPGGPWAGT